MTITGLGPLTTGGEFSLYLLLGSLYTKLPMSVLPVSTKSSENMSGEEKEKTSSKEKAGDSVDTEKVYIKLSICY